ncbi:MAG: hypothetical protein AAFV53_34185 [Myxococcota bacterium]
MRRLGLACLMGFSLACAGISEGIVEGLTGQEITITDDGLEMTLPEDGRVKVRWGEGLQHPSAIPLQPPSSGQVVAIGEVTFPDKPTSTFAVYDGVNESVDEVLARYRVSLETMGLTVTEENQDGQRSLQAERGDIMYFVSMDASGTLTLGVGSKSALEQGIQAQQSI